MNSSKTSSGWRRMSASGLLQLKIPSAILLFITVLVVFGAAAPKFLSLMNLQNILLHSSPLALLATGMTLVMLTNGIDLSVGSLVSLVCVVIAGVLSMNVSVAAAIAVGIAVSGGFGLLSGLVVAKVKLPPFIVTLAAMAMAASLALVLSGGDTLYWEKNWFNLLATSRFLGIPVPFWIVAAVFALVVSMLHFTGVGAYVYGLGSNAEGLRLAGVPVDRYRILVYLLNGLITGVAGTLIASRIASGNPIVGTGYEFEAIAAAAIGGVSFVGGKGHPAFAALSAVTITMIMNGLGLLGFTTPWQYCAIGVVLVIGMFLNRVLSTGIRRPQQRKEEGR
jgi:ribose transport system permease protein